MNFASKLSKEIKKNKREGKRKKVDDEGSRKREKRDDGREHNENGSEGKGDNVKSENGTRGTGDVTTGSQNGARSRTTRGENKSSDTNSNNPVSTTIKPLNQAKPSITNTSSQKHKRYELQRQKEAATDPIINITEINPQNYNKLALQVRIYIKQLVQQWAQQESIDKTHLYETKLDLVLLLYKLRSEGLTETMVISLATICYYLQNDNFRKASESYMKLSLGNVAWPIGVMNVGIHERSKSIKTMGKRGEELYDANIMLDDKTRKWIVAIKRLISVKEKIGEEMKKV